MKKSSKESFRGECKKKFQWLLFYPIANKKKAPFFLIALIILLDASMMRSSLRWLIQSFFYALFIQWSIFPTMEKFISFSRSKWHFSSLHQYILNFLSWLFVQRSLFPLTHICTSPHCITS